MIDFALSDEERLLQETARRFAEERLAPALRAHERARGVTPEVAARFAALGLEGAGPFGRALVLEELAAVDPGAATALDGPGPAAHVLAEAGLPLEPGMRGVAIDDSDERFRVADGRIDGTTAWVPADRIDVAVVLQPARALVVRSGWRLTPLDACGLGAAGGASLVLDAAPVATVVDRPAALARARARIRTDVAALLVGAARGALRYAIAYATERTAFGRPIAHHQGLAFLLVDLATGVDVARLAVQRAAAVLERGEPAEQVAATALAEAAEQALAVGPGAVQVLGGHGFMKDHPVEKWMRDIRTLAQLAGGRDAAELALAYAASLS
jgi:alkylation response protein AidB-like acyl-CoA dehydrogenase